jgi:hypothetical protein
VDEDSIKRYLIDTFRDVDHVESEGNYYFFYNPDKPPDYKYPFVTLMTNDINDRASNLDRPSVYRLNIGVNRETYQSLFGSQPPQQDATGIASTRPDFSSLDHLMPHPVYAPQSWICVLNPGPATLDIVKELLVEAYQKAVGRHKWRRATGSTE